jgi:hypothetical protein
LDQEKIPKAAAGAVEQHQEIHGDIWTDKEAEANTVSDCHNNYVKVIMSPPSARVFPNFLGRSESSIGGRRGHQVAKPASFHIFFD